jgi:hypothetical protein
MWKLTEKMFVTNVDLKAARPVKKSPCVVGIVVQLVEAKVKRPESIGEKPVNIPKGRRRQVLVVADAGRRATPDASPVAESRGHVVAFRRRVRVSK